MKLEIESTIRYNEREEKEIDSEILEIINKVTIAKNQSDLEERFNGRYYKHFEIGFGANHMWVHQVHLGATMPKRLIFVNF